MATQSPEGTEVPADQRDDFGAPVDDPVAAREACSARVLEREGIPVVLVLLDRRTGSPTGSPTGADAAQGPAAGEGPALLALFDRYAGAVAPGAPDDDAEALYSVVELIGFTHLHPGPAPTATSTATSTGERP